MNRIIPLLILPFCFFLKSCLRDHDVAEFEVTGLNLLPATTATNNGMPATTNDSIPRKLFSLEVQFEISSNLESIEYDSNESYSKNTNPIDSLRIWCNQPFSGTPAGETINSDFYVLKENYSDAVRLGSGAPFNLSKSNNSVPYYTKVDFICDSDPAPGSYKFYTEFYFENGTSIQDSTELITLE